MFTWVGAQSQHRRPTPQFRLKMAYLIDSNLLSKGDLELVLL